MAPPRLFGGLERHGSRLAVLGPDGSSWTHAALAAAADSWAATHLNLGAERGLLALEMANTIEPLLALIGACRAGWPVLLLGAGRLAADPRLRIQFKPDVEFTRESTGWHVRRDVWRQHEPVQPPPLPGGEAEAVGRAPGFETEPEALTVAPHPELAILLTTSGSSGDPKLVRLSARNLVSNALSIAWYLDITPDERAITSLPLHYSYGLSVLTSHLLTGASIVLTERSVHEAAFWEAFEMGGATSLAGVPLTYENLAAKGFLQRPIPGLRTLTQAGGRLDPSLVRRFAHYAGAHGMRFFVMYGQTEASPRMAFLPPELAVSHGDCIGQAVPGGVLRIENDLGEEILEPGVAGELIYSGPNVMMGYALCREDLGRGHELTELRTGDIAERTSEGLWRIVGRSSRFVKIAGLRISLDGIEADLREAGLNARVAGDDARIVLGIVSRLTAPPGLAAAWVRRLGIPPKALRVVLLHDVPVLANGKTDYRAILEAGGPAVSPVAESGLRRELAAILGRSALDDEESFTSAGGDSLNLVEGAIAVERFYGERLPGWECMPMAELCQENADTIPERGRDDPLLVARSFALWLAMSAHVIFKFDLFRFVPQALAVTAFATPLLLVVFGLGLARKFGRGLAPKFQTLTGWCWPLAGTYYAAIAITVLAQGLGGEMEWGPVGRALYFNAEGIYAGIWMTYFWMMLLAPLLVWPIRRWGGWGVAIVVGLPWLVWPWLSGAEEVNYFWGHLLGWGSVTGPSVLHATSFVVFGFLLGAIKRPGLQAAMVGSVLVWTLWLFTMHIERYGWETVWKLIAYQEYRRLTHPVYMAFGATGALVFLSAAWVIARIPRSPVSLRDLFYSFGRSSVFAYTFGNLVLIFTPNLKLDLWGGLTFGVIFLGLLALITDDVTRWRPRLFGPVARGLRAVNLRILRLMRPRGVRA